MKVGSTIFGEFDEQSAKKFHESYIAADINGNEIFTWKGEQILTRLAKYVVEDLQNKGVLCKEKSN